MKKHVETFLNFCDRHNLSFEIIYRANFAPHARFFLTFGTVHSMHYMGESELVPFHFANGNTPNEAMENAIRELKGKWVQFKTLKDGWKMVTINFPR